MITTWTLVIFLYTGSGGDVAVDHISGLTEQQCTDASKKISYLGKWASEAKIVCIEGGN